MDAINNAAESVKKTVTGHGHTNTVDTSKITKPVEEMAEATKKNVGDAVNHVKPQESLMDKAKGLFK
ncbi:hypothetical protein SOVF_197020 [Spinacia oleracea]|nr:hypothetical protein SOVF_197020 [Spinacia oleracea]